MFPEHQTQKKTSNQIFVYLFLFISEQSLWTIVQRNEVIYNTYISSYII